MDKLLAAVRPKREPGRPKPAPRPRKPLRTLTEAAALALARNPKLSREDVKRLPKEARHVLSWALYKTDKHGYLHIRLFSSVKIWHGNVYARAHVMSHTRYLCGKKHGPSANYSNRGRIIERGHYRWGNLDGAQVRAPSKDSTRDIDIYRDDTKVMTQTYQDNVLLKETYFRGGFPHRMITYATDGYVESIKTPFGRGATLVESRVEQSYVSIVCRDVEKGRLLVDTNTFIGSGPPIMAIFIEFNPRVAIDIINPARYSWTRMSDKAPMDKPSPGSVAPFVRGSIHVCPETVARDAMRKIKWAIDSSTYLILTDIHSEAVDDAVWSLYQDPGNGLSKLAWHTMRDYLETMEQRLPDSPPNTELLSQRDELLQDLRTTCADWAAREYSPQMWRF